MLVPSGCYMDARSGSAGSVVKVDSTVTGLGFELVLPSPLSLKSGIYRAQLQLSVGGSGADFDLGNRVTNVSTDLLTLNFEFTVKHPLKVEFPAGSERAVLEPPGGWMGWINRGAAPQRLYRILPFESGLRVQSACTPAANTTWADAVAFAGAAVIRFR
nr:hypothetical protein [Pseudomonas sp. BIGb0427]